jgi:hypothetical protein
MVKYKYKLSMGVSYMNNIKERILQLRFNKSEIEKKQIELKMEMDLCDKEIVMLQDQCEHTDTHYSNINEENEYNNEGLKCYWYERETICNDCGYSEKQQSKHEDNFEITFKLKKVI